MNETRELARFVAETRYDDLPAALVERAKVYVLDNIASAFVGAAQPSSRMVAEMVRALGGREQATVVGKSWKADVSRAALANGAMIGAFEVEHVGHLAHPGGTVFPAALALAESEGLDGKSFLLAMALGYEVTCRVGAAQTRATEQERGFHNPGVNGPFGAAAASGKLLGLDAEGMAWALGTAASHSAGLVESFREGAMTKRLHLGRASQSGLESALLARKGFTGPTTALEGEAGYLNAFSPSPEPERLLADLGSRWLAADMVIKAYPCHVTAQSTVHAILELQREHAVPLQDIRRVVITAGRRVATERHLDASPTTPLGAQYSLPFSAALAFAHDISDPLNLTEKAIGDLAVRNLARRVEVRLDEERFDRTSLGAEIAVETSQGSYTLSAGGFPGSLEQPLDFDGAREKLRRFTASLLDDARREEIAAVVADLEGLQDAASLALLLA